MENKNGISTLFFDIGGVLLSKGWSRSMRKRAAENFGLNENLLEERHQLVFETYELGKFSLKEYLEIVVFHEKRNFTLNEFRSFMFLQSQSFPKMLDMARRLKEKYKLKVFAVSNEGRELNDHRINRFKLNDLIDSFISSSFVHLRKPDISIYNLALDIAQVPANRVLYIEDTPLFVEMAKSLGMNAIDHVDYESTLEKLEIFGLTV
jgi:haloacid dehalogenase superfamily, subfamily IA, variant 3 with third motif having DD or ED